jgi:CheY-like chemotaxis protein
MDSVGRLAGGVAHDFNNMLGVILGYTEMALLGMDSRNPLYGSLSEIHKAAKRSADLTRQLLTFARKQNIVPKSLDLNTVIEGIIKMLSRLVGENVELVFHPGKDLWPVKVDPSQIDQILANLCVNARDAIEETGQITLETARVVLGPESEGFESSFAAGEYVMLSFRDDGCGMEKEVLSHIFEPFFTTKSLEKGTGLGLATVYGIVKQNNGFIHVDSEVGGGSIFRIYLPRFEGEVDASVTRGFSPVSSDESVTILVVEDEPVILEMTQAMLEQLNYKVLSASDKDRALELAREMGKEINLLITDVIMPVINGKDLAELIKPLCPAMKCLFMSGYSADIIARHGVLDPEVFFIQKPFSLTELSTRINEVLASD